MKGSNMTKYVSKNIYNKELTKAVFDQIGGDYEFKGDDTVIFDDFIHSQLENCYNHGADCGITGFIYYAETVAFFNANRELILDRARNEAESLGESGIISFFKCFNCFKGLNEDDIASGLYEPDSENETTIKNGLAWYALEEVARDIMDGDVETIDDEE